MGPLLKRRHRACQFCPVSSSYLGVSSTNLTAAKSTFILVLLLAAVQIVSDTFANVASHGGPRRDRRPSPSSHNNVLENFGMEATLEELTVSAFLPRQGRNVQH